MIHDDVFARPALPWAAFANDAFASWPEVDVSLDAFEAHVRAKLVDAGFDVGEFGRLRAPELGLAFACGHGDKAALRALELHYGRDIDAPLVRIHDPHLKVEDLWQIVRLRLLVAGPQGPAAIMGYGGQGRLSAWLRVTSRRTGLNATRRLALPVVEAADHIALLGTSTRLNPELGYLRDNYGAVFHQAFVAAIGGLDPRQRTLLRMAFVQNLRVRTIGRMYGVHHATAARWVKAAQQALVDDTVRRIQGHIAVSESQLASIFALIQSRVDVELAELLGPASA
jgi:RNA polymerase sigma-70 factor, ECF subfamily